MGRYVMAEDYVRALRGRERCSRVRSIARSRAWMCSLLPSLADSGAADRRGHRPVKGGQEPCAALMLRCTQLFNLTGHPAISLPCGDDRAGLPVGLQLVGRKGGTRRCCSTRSACEARAPDARMISSSSIAGSSASPRSAETDRHRAAVRLGHRLDSTIGRRVAHDVRIAATTRGAADPPRGCRRGDGRHRRVLHAGADAPTTRWSPASDAAARAAARPAR